MHINHLPFEISAGFCRKISFVLGLVSTFSSILSYDLFKATIPRLSIKIWANIVDTARRGEHQSDYLTYSYKRSSRYIFLPFQWFELCDFQMSTWRVTTFNKYWWLKSDYFRAFYQYFGDKSGFLVTEISIGYFQPEEYFSYLKSGLPEEWLNFGMHNCQLKSEYFYGHCRGSAAWIVEIFKFNFFAWRVSTILYNWRVSIFKRFFSFIWTLPEEWVCFISNSFRGFGGPCMSTQRDLWFSWVWKSFGSFDILAETREFGQKTYPDIPMGEVLARYQMAESSLSHVWPVLSSDGAVQGVQDLKTVVNSRLVDGLRPKLIRRGRAWAAHRQWPISRPKPSPQSSQAVSRNIPGPTPFMASRHPFLIHGGSSQPIGTDGRLGVRPRGKSGGWMASGQKSAQSIREAVRVPGTSVPRLR